MKMRDQRRARAKEMYIAVDELYMSEKSPPTEVVKKYSLTAFNPSFS
jgi:hypothetical protein